MTDQSSLQKFLPTVSTGNVVVDAAIRGFLGAVAAAATGAASLVLEEHGITSKDVLIAVPDVVWAGIGLVGTAVIVWWQARAKQSMKDLAVNAVLIAAQTQTVPDAVKKLATPAQKQQIAVAGK